MKTPLQILCLEDYDADATLINRKLRDIATLTVVDRRELFERALAKPWDTILIDYKLSDITGAEAIQIARNRQPDTPVILITGSMDDGNAVSVACQYGAVDCLTKDRLDRLKMAVTRAEERRQAGAENRKLQQERIRDQRLEILGNLSAGISHDMNNVLGTILLGSEQLRELTRSEGHRILDVMETAAKRGAEMIKQLLAFARGNNGDAFKPVDPSFILGEIGQMLRSGMFPNIRSTVRVEVGTSKLLCDQTQMHQCLLNLVINARDAMANGGEIHVAAQDATMDTDSIKGRFVLLSVRDTGTGIPPEVLPNIFTPFFTTKPKGKGTGMGLAIVKAIVLGHGGDIEVKTTPSGTIFYLYIPAADGTGTTHETKKAEPFDGTGKVVVLVDDEEFIRTVVAMLLEDAGYTVISCVNGPEALETFRTGKSVDLLISDCSMPIMDGPVLIAQLRAEGFATPAVLITGLDSPAQPDQDCPVIHKPFTRETLLATCKRLLTPAGS